MRTSLLFRAAIAAAVSVFVLTAAGCDLFAPPMTDGPPVEPVQYKPRTTRANVIYNLSSAYEERNLDEYMDCLAEEFTFHLAQVDLDEDATLPEYWGKAMERSIHEKMFGIVPVQNPENEVEKITLTLTTGPYDHDEGADPVDPMDDRWTYRLSTDLMVWFPNNLQRRADADVEFVFRIDPLETNPEDGDTLFEIVKWEDLATDGGSFRPLQPDVEETSFGLLKATYLE